MGLIDEIAHAVDADTAAVRGAAQGASRCGSSSASGARSTSATSRPTTCCRSRRCASGCARTRWSDAVIWRRAGPPRGDAPTTPSAASRATCRCRWTTAAASRRTSWRARPPSASGPRCGCSPLARARETAEIVGAAIGHAPDRRRALRRDRLRRLDRPLFDEVRGRRARSCSPPSARPTRTSRSPAASRSPQQQQRVAGGHRRRARRAALPALVVCHRGSIRLALAALRGDEPLRSAEVPNASLVELRDARGRGRRSARWSPRRSAAFFVAQRLKHAPSDVKRLSPPSHLLAPTATAARTARRSASTSRRPTTYGRHRRQRRRPRALAASTTATSQRATRRSAACVWNGRDDEGRVVPDGIYRVRVTLRREGRAVFLPTRDHGRRHRRRSRKVVAIGPQGATCPSCCRAAATAGAQTKVVAPGIDRRLLIFRTDVRPFKLVRTLPLAPGQNEQDWDGTDDAGRPVPDGTYVVVAQARDTPGTPARRRRSMAPGAPVPLRHALRGHGGVTVRYIAVQPPLIPPRAGTLMHALVDARGKRVHVDDPPPRPGRRGSGAAGRKDEVRANVHAPRGASGALPA